MVDVIAKCGLAGKREANAYDALSELDLSHKRRLALIEVARGFDRDIFSKVPKMAGGLREIEKIYRDSGRRQKHSLMDYWDAQQVEDFDKIVDCFSLRRNFDYSKIIDSIYAGRVFVEKEDVNVIPTFGNAGRRASGDAADFVLPGLFFGGLLGFSGLILSNMAYDGIVGNDGFPNWNFCISGTIASAVLGGVLSYLASCKSNAIANPFEKIASGLEFRANYVGEVIKRIGLDEKICDRNG